MKKFFLFHSHLQFANLECPMNDLQDPLVFLDTQVSLAPTHVSKLVSWLVSPLVTLSDFQSLVSNGRSNQKNSKNKVHLFSNFASGRTSQLVPNPFNWSPAHSTGPQKLFFTEISVSVAQIKKFKKLSPFIFEF